MGRRTKKQSAKPRARGFENKPFAGLKAAVKNTDAPTPQTPPPTPPVPPLVPNEEEDVLAQMMTDTTPIEHHRVPGRPNKLNPRQQMSDDELVVSRLDELVHGLGHFDVAESDEFIEAKVVGLDPRIVKKLRRGEFAIQAHLDLHGYTRDEARDEVAGFINRAYSRGLRCVLIVHGRGLGSKDGIPVLKEKLRVWLTRGAIGKKVLAYSSARPYDGGTGAIYVLLRA